MQQIIIHDVKISSIFYAYNGIALIISSYFFMSIIPLFKGLYINVFDIEIYDLTNHPSRNS